MPDSSAAGKKAQVKKVAVRDLLSQLIKFRNSVAHGERMTGKDNAEALAKLRAVVSGHEFYADYRLIVRDGKRWLDCDGPGVQELGEGHYVPEWWTPRDQCWYDVGARPRVRRVRGRLEARGHT